MTRRGWLGAAAASVAPVGGLKAAEGQTFFESHLAALVDGYLQSARRTSASMAVCDFTGGRKRSDGVALSGKTYCSVSRMLPALAACVLAGRDSDGRLYQAILSVYRNAFDPNHPDYWGPAPPDKPDLRQVESSLIAWVLWILRQRILADLTSGERSNVQAWLASCTVLPVRGNNFAWFTAVNHAVRLSLAEHWPEFQGDEAFMLADLQAMDEMYVGDGWYCDGKGSRIVDYYSFWVFTSHYLYWREIIGSRYPDWDRRFGQRTQALLKLAPQLFSDNGAHALMGVSLVYRWAILTALVLGYRQRMWPHSPGLLRRIVRRNLDFFWDNDAFDSEHSKLRERMSAAGNPEFAESYIDNGHPYWGMQAWAFLLIPRTDPFWSAAETSLPCEERDYTSSVAGPGLLVSGSRRTGEARIYFAANGRFAPAHRDRYTKFSYSGRFFFCYTKQQDRATWDNALVFRDPGTGAMAGRAGVTKGRLIDGGVETEWWAMLGDLRIDVTSRLTAAGERERRSHTIHAPKELLSRRIEFWEGSAALPVGRNEEIRTSTEGRKRLATASAGSVGVLEHRGYDTCSVDTQFAGWFGRENIHIFTPRCGIVTLRGVVRMAVTSLQSEFLSLPAKWTGVPA